MRLESLELQGFKTFPDKTRLTFDSGISVVVGPNGSGKSNLSDAVRWVLGEQSVRTLRCSKMEDILFGGTPSRRQLGFAQVTLTIDNHDRTLPFDGDTVAITRRYYRSGESEYQINHATVRLRDIHELLMDTGLGRDGYCILGQGKIDSVVSARAEDRREIFEEAAGISRYRYRKEEAERKLSQAEENLLRLRDLAGELEARVGPLREQAEKAKRYLTLAEEKQQLEIGLWLHTLHRSGRVLREQDDAILLAHREQEEQAVRLGQLEAAIEENFQQGNACLVQMEQLRNEAARQEAEALRLEGGISVFKNDLSHNQLARQRLHQEWREREQGLAQLIQEEEETRLALAQNQTLLEEKNRQAADMEQRLEQLSQSLAASGGQLEQDNRRMEVLSGQAAKAQAAALSAAVSQEELALRLTALEETRESRGRLAAQRGQALSEQERQVQEAAQRAADLQAQIQQNEQLFRSRQEQAEQARKQWEQAQLDVREQGRRIQLLEELERNLEGFSHSVKRILRESSKGALSGIHGPVSRLLTVPSDYAAAIEVALGAAQQNLVVDTEADAKAAIRFLKKNDGGRATFLPLSTIRASGLSESGLEKCKGFVGIAEGLCRYETRYQSVVRSLLGRIVVAQDLDCAVAIAKQYDHRFRIVTLDGQVIHPGGSLTGGSLSKHTGSLSRTAEISRLKQALAQQKERQAQRQTQWEACRAQLAQAEKDRETLRAQAEAAQEARVEQTSLQSQLRADFETLRRQQEELEEEIAAIRTRQTELETVRLREQDQHARLEEQKNQLQQTLSQRSGNREADHRRQEQGKADLQALRLALLVAQKDGEALRLSAQTQAQRRTEINRRMQALREEEGALEQADRALEQQIAESRTSAGRLREQAKEARAKSDQIQRQRLELEKKSVELRGKEREQAEHKERMARELARLEERKAAFQKEYDDIIRRLWEDYELTRREAEEIAEPVREPARAQRRLNALKTQIRALGVVNTAAVEEYREVAERYEFFTTQLRDVEKSREELRRLIHDLSGQMQTLFVERFEKINRNFQQTFARLFGGGQARLELEHPEELLTCGIAIIVQPPGKLVSNLELLSGGERALVAIALYFAIMKVNPPPFCVMDEIEAALDESNVERFAAFLRVMNEKTQFVVITHRRGTMEEADVLYGVTMQEEGVSKLLKMKPSDFETL